MIQFQCPHCGQKMQVDDAHAGRRGTCPGCKQVVEIPGLAAPQPPAGSAPGAAPGSPGPAEPGRPPPPSGPAAEAPPTGGAAGAGGGKKRTSGLSIAALICGLLGCLGITAIAAVVLGILGIRDVNRNKGQVGGMGMAVAGLVLGCLFSLIFLPAFLAAMLLPNLTAAWKSAQKTQCAANLKSIGGSLKMYATGGRNNPYPSLYSREGDARRAQETWGGPSAWDAATWELTDRGSEGTALEDRGPFTCNLHCLWLVVRSGMCDAQVFACPNDANQLLDETWNPDEWWSFESLHNCSYSYQNQLGRTMTEGGLSAKIAIMADKSPGRPDVSGKPSGPAAAKPWYEWNSPNHEWTGQNVLYGDGHVEFTTEPTCGYSKNNIWIKEKWNPATKAWEPDGPTDYGRYDEGVSDRRDTWLVP